MPWFVLFIMNMNQTEVQAFVLPKTTPPPKGIIGRERLIRTRLIRSST